MRMSSWVVCLAGLCLAAGACSDEAKTTNCNNNDQLCPPGQYCGPGGLCTLDCKTDNDCNGKKCNSLGKCVGGQDFGGADTARADQNPWTKDLIPPDTYAPTPDLPPPDQQVWPDIWPDQSNMWPDWYMPPDQYTGSPFGCKKDSDCFGKRCCPTPWGVKLCKATCNVP